MPNNCAIPATGYDAATSRLRGTDHRGWRYLRRARKWHPQTPPASAADPWKHSTTAPAFQFCPDVPGILHYAAQFLHIDASFARRSIAHIQKVSAIQAANQPRNIGMFSRPKYNAGPQHNQSPVRIGMLPCHSEFFPPPVWTLRMPSLGSGANLHSWPHRSTHTEKCCW